jgi:antitoxin component HigA of HigAB toxin-antitoxin module
LRVMNENDTPAEARRYALSASIAQKIGNRERGLPMNALPIRPIAETADSVTLSRADFETLAELVSDAQDLADADAVKARLAAGETETFPFAVAERLLDGEHPVTVLREHRAFTVRGLAEVAGVSPSYLSEIESGKKPGSFDAMARVAAALHVPLDLLVRA